MSENADSSGPTRGRGRGNSRGGLGKYLRARGRGRGFGRPAEFTTRLVLEGERKPTLDDEEEAERARELAQKFSRRQLGTNADRYKEEEVELDSDGEPIVEPEVDLSTFLQKQLISEETGPAMRVAKTKYYDEGDVDTSLAHISSNNSRMSAQTISKKGKMEEIAWDETLDEMTREKQAAEATWDLKTRFRAKSEKLRAKPVPPTLASRSRKQEYRVEAPALPLPESANAEPKTHLSQMEDFLDDLLS
ncbi:hypothetical protein HYPSUDRAFT_36230 [Hypholoma sublateritium FD-334 SS-4]|uniref:Uncharacterized protein n=1 Tax=Hypholoma sublateritium (strain FD-334 SS-4) TaxID=945553 RepID=A0A0D2MR86_HYPSF|nr:hypothetical protein HYPSUDRAFT_36230 [Hypholoma sublateritium FD-334 SS-4]